MPRPYSEEFLRALARANPDRIGVRLGKVCVKANFPSSYVAKALNVSRFTIHKWFRGEYLRDANYKKVEVFVKLVEESLAKGVLPAATFLTAKTYLDSISTRVNKVV